MMNEKQLLEVLAANEEFQTTNQLKATYFLTPGGKQISFGYEYGYRSNDHRIIFGIIDNVERNDWKNLIETTGLLTIMPESMEAFTLKGVELSSKQKAFIKKHNLDLMME